MQLLSARNQRHKKVVRISVTVNDVNGDGSSNRNRIGWDNLLGDEPQDNPVAKAMLAGWCCGFDMDLQEKMKSKR